MCRLGVKEEGKCVDVWFSVHATCETFIQRVAQLCLGNHVHISPSSAWKDSSLFESPGFGQQIVASVLKPSATVSDIFRACDSFTQELSAAVQGPMGKIF